MYEPAARSAAPKKLGMVDLLAVGFDILLFSDVSMSSRTYRRGGN